MLFLVAVLLSVEYNKSNTSRGLVMITIEEMKEKLVEELYVFYSSELPVVCSKIGLDCGTKEEAYNSKKKYVRKRIEKLDKNDLISVLYKLKASEGIDIIPDDKYKYSITELTKNDIVDILCNGIEVDDFPLTEHCQIDWSGRLSAFDFLDKFIDTSNLKASCSRYDSYYHEIGEHYHNCELPDNWVFYDDQLPFKARNSKEILNFLCGVFHPEVRSRKENWVPILEEINKLLKEDGFEIVPDGEISGRTVYGWRELKFIGKSIVNKAEEIVEVFNSDYHRKQIKLMNDSLKGNSAVAIGKAKEILEACFKFVLDTKSVSYTTNDSLQQLDKKVRINLNLDKKTNKSTIAGVEKVLSGLSNITHGLAELRNAFGDGHGKSLKFVELPPRYAELAVGAATTYASFLLDTLSDVNK